MTCRRFIRQSHSRKLENFAKRRENNGERIYCLLDEDVCFERPLLDIACVDQHGSAQSREHCLIYCRTVKRNTPSKLQVPRHVKGFNFALLQEQFDRLLSIADDRGLSPLGLSGSSMTGRPYYTP